MMTTTVIFQQHPKQGNLKKEGKSVKRITEDKTKAREVRKKQKTPPQKLIVRIEKKKKRKGPGRKVNS